MQPYQPFHSQWLMAIAAAFGLAFMLAVGTAGCAPHEAPDAFTQTSSSNGESAQGALIPTAPRAEATPLSTGAGR